MKALDIMNWGETQGNTEKEKFFNEETDLQVMAIVAKAKALMKLKEMGIDPSVLEGGGEGQQGKPHGGGRPSSGQKAPKLAQKGAQGGNPRTVVKES